MTMDLWLLLGATLWTWLLIMAAATPGVLRDPVWAMGNREDPKEEPAWAKRLKRAAENMKENLPLYAVLVLVAHVAGKTNETTALAGQVFIGARVAHALVYTAGVPVARTLIWIVSIGAMAVIGMAIAG